MTLRRGRIVRAADAGGREIAPIVLPGASPRQRHRLAREELEARAGAAQVRADALAKVEEIVGEARRRADELARHAIDDARATEATRFAALYLALRLEDARREERDQDRVIALATVLAERIVGETLALDPAKIANLAKRALAEARGARRIVIETSPGDVDTLRIHLAPHLRTLGLPDDTVRITANEDLARGDLCLHTDLGTLHARITPQLERLAEALRDALQSS